MKAAVFKNLAPKLAKKFNTEFVQLSTTRPFFTLSYNFKTSTKWIAYQHYFRLRQNGTQIAMCENVGITVFVLEDTSFAKKDHSFTTTLQEAKHASNAVLEDFGNSKRLKKYDITKPPSQPKAKHHFMTTN